MKTGRLVVGPDGSLREEGWCVRLPRTLMTGPDRYLNTTKMRSLRINHYFVATRHNVSNLFRRLEDAVAAALIVDGEVEEL